MANTHHRWVFFGTPEFSSITLDELAQAGYLPSLIVTAPDKPRGRGLVVTPSEVNTWGTEHNIPVITPSTLKDAEIEKILREVNAEFFVVAAYGKIIPKAILDVPPHGVLNVHPSLLPKFRGSSPIESAILSDETHTGVTIMLLDEEMDHGPIVAQRERITNDWPPKGSMLTRDLAHFGGALLAEIIPEWLGGLKAEPQDHAKATFTKKITKEDGQIDLADDPAKNLKKVRAFDEWPGAYTFVAHEGRSIRLKILDATIEEGKFVPTRVIPEGKKEMDYQDFIRGLH